VVRALLRVPRLLLVTLVQDCQRFTVLINVLAPVLLFAGVGRPEASRWAAAQLDGPVSDNGPSSGLVWRAQFPVQVAVAPLPLPVPWNPKLVV
jgi:hypothetical protein